MASLLSLPLELRSRIIHYTLVSSVPAASEGETAKLLSEQKPRSRRWRPKFDYPALTFLGTASIYRVNRQLRYEAKTVAELSGPVEYHLDLIVWRRLDRCIPCWTYTSQPSKSVDILRCTIRPQGKFVYTDHHSWFNGGDGGPPPASWIGFDLIVAFLNHGPRLRAYEEDCSQHHRFHIKKLVINIEPPTASEDQASEDKVRLWSLERWERQNSWQTGEVLRICPRYLHKFLQQHMDILLSCSYDTGGYGDALFQSIGLIEFEYNGEVTRTFDLGNMLKGYKDEAMPAADTFPTNHRIYWTRQTWIPLVQRYRTERGLESGAGTASDKSLGANLLDTSYYKSWDDCERIVIRTRPGT